MLDPLLFKLVTTPEKETALLVIPEICAAVIKTYLPIRDNYLGITNHLPDGCRLQLI